MTSAPNPSVQSTLIIGQGRSGTNMLLGFLDLSPKTHCRNEPNALPGCAFATLERHRFHVDDAADLEARWDARRESPLPRSCPAPRGAPRRRR